MKNHKPITIISGATATGKTSLAIKMAKQKEEQNYSSVIINFDSLLFYKELNIGTAKPTIAERHKIIHELIDIRSAHHPLNAHDFTIEAQKLIQYYLQKNYYIFLVGGSGFYLRALIKGMYNSPPISLTTKHKLRELEEQFGYDYLRQQLATYDPISYEKIHHNDHYRTIRALEHFFEHQYPLSQEQSKLQQQEPYNFQKNIHGWNLDHYYLTVPKAEHWEIIKQRTQKMLQQGLIQEVEKLLNMGFTGTEKPLQSIGYKETIDYLNKKIASQDELLERIYINTRRLAKSQKTFFQKITPKKIFIKNINY